MSDLRPASEFPGPPPWHFNCRTVLIPVLASWSEMVRNPDLAERLRGVGDDPGTRSSLNGAVAGDLNYDAWLRTQPRDVQIEALGQAKHSLWEDGKLTLPELIDTSGRPLTLAQLKKKVT